MTAEPFCEAVTDVCISRADQLTEPTARALRANSAGRTKVCGPPPPCGNVKSAPAKVAANS